MRALSATASITAPLAARPVRSIATHQSTLGHSTRERLESLVLKEIKGNYAILTLNRPKVNAIDYELLQALRMRYHELEAIDKVRGLIISSRPGVYSGGLDVPYLLTLNEPQMEEWYAYFSETFAEMLSSPLFTIAAISGHAPAGGCVIAFTADYRVMVKGDYKIGLNEVAVGLTVPPGVIALARQIVGSRGAEKMFLTAKLFPVDEAKSLGIVDEVVEPERLLPHCEAVMQQRLSTIVPTAFANTKREMRKDVLSAFDQQRRLSKEWSRLWFSAETQGALASFKANLAKKSNL